MNGEESICPVCEEYSFDYPEDYDICLICGWEIDGLQREQKDWGGANNLCVNEAKTVLMLLKNKEKRFKVSQLVAFLSRSTLISPFLKTLMSFSKTIL